MDIYDSVALRRPKAFASNLKRLPTELVHQIIQELPLITILQILSHKDPHLDRCVLTHKDWRKLFTKQQNIDGIIDIFILYREICRFTGAPSLWPASLLGLRGNSIVFGRDIGIVHVKLHLQESIRDALPRNKREMAILEAHATTPYPGHDAELSIRWEWVKDSKRNLNRAKASQLIICADLMSQFPEKLMLKKPLDPSQGPPRKNLKHIEEQLRHLAKQALQHNKLVYPEWMHYHTCKLAVDNIELVPHDRYLWFFMEMLENHPPLADGPVDTLVPGLTISAKSKEPNVAKSKYPPNIDAAIAVVLNGLSFVYTGYPLLVVPRIRWEGRRLATGPDSKKPAFEHDLIKHPNDLPMEFHRCGVSKVMTYDEREYEWLRSFLKVVTWMEKKFGAVEIPVEE